MQVTFLIGGTGNQLFQYASAPPDAVMSTFFLQPGVRSVLGWTQHEQFIQYEEPSIIELILALGVLGFDLILAKLAKISLFTELDTRRLKARAKIKPMVRLGYFQLSAAKRDLKPLSRQIAPKPEHGTIAVHVRGGDILALERAGRNDYGLLDSDYYCKAIIKARNFMRGQGRTPTRLIVLTDDTDYAATLNLKVEGVPDRELLSVPLRDTLARAVGAEWYISSNSTMSYWIIRLREGKLSIAPQPFQKRRDYDLHRDVERIPVYH